MSEILEFLGWLLDTHRHLVSLPEAKFKAYAAAIVRLLGSTEVDKKELESVLGKLNQTANIMPLTRHFTARLRCALARAEEGPTTFTTEELEDLRLWLKFLGTAFQGISINLLVKREPDITVWSDSCPWGLGGHTALGLVWRYYLPEAHRGKLSNNDLELIAG